MLYNMYSSPQRGTSAFKLVQAIAGQLTQPLVQLMVTAYNRPVLLTMLLHAAAQPCDAQTLLMSRLIEAATPAQNACEQYPLCKQQKGM